MTATGRMTLVEFLLERIVDDEAAAEEWNAVITGSPIGDWIHEVRRRVLADCEAKRRVVALHPAKERREWYECAVCFDPDTAPGDYDFEDWPCPTLRLLALPYADHPDYDEAWRP